MMSCALHLKGAEAGETVGVCGLDMLYVCVFESCCQVFFLFGFTLNTLKCFM